MPETKYYPVLAQVLFTLGTLQLTALRATVIKTDRDLEADDYHLLHHLLMAYEGPTKSYTEGALTVSDYRSEILSYLERLKRGKCFSGVTFEPLTETAIDMRKVSVTIVNGGT